ncbi:hypothetical protein GCM10007923_55630 [Shinella yambaruensis]|uniref:DNA-binding protein n=1 Tax=Shinella yambaruensis TaxID=415996 RepID=A0ABQ5ZRF6_9HYPH|nr:hypothetical protein GCM10007923_55630 [Shinella yambaruensis]
MTPDPELLIGPKAISNFLGITERQLRWLDGKHRLPTFRLDRRLAARPTSLRDWLRDVEEKGRRDRKTCLPEV